MIKRIITTNPHISSCLECPYFEQRGNIFYHFYKECKMYDFKVNGNFFTDFDASKAWQTIEDWFNKKCEFPKD
jgi:hypothetical protein